MKQRYRFRTYEPDGGSRGHLTSPGDYAFSSTYNDIPGMTLKYQDASPGSQYLFTPGEVAVEFSVDGITWEEPRNCRYLRLARSEEVIGSDDVRGYTLPGYGHLLEKARQMVTTGLNADNKRAFNSSTAGRIMATLLQENQTSWGALPGMDWDFSTTHDSNGVAWDKIVSIAYEPGLDLLTIIRNLGDQDICDWWFEGRTLRMTNVSSTVRNVTLRPGVDLKKMPVQGNLDDLVHTVLVTGDAGARMVLDTQFDAPVLWGKWLGHIGNGGVSDPATMTILGNSMLESGSREKLQYNLEIDTLVTGWEPFVDYVAGDFVHSVNSSRAAEDYRIHAINVARNAAGEISLTLIANDRFLEKEVARARRINGITGGATTGGSGVRPSPEVPAGKKPTKVVGVAATSEAYINSVGFPLGFVIVSWPDVVTDVDGFALEIDRYEVQGTSAGRKVSWGSFEDSPGSKDELECGTVWDVRVRAVSNKGVAGAWSDEYFIEVASDVTPPAVPSTPILTTYLGTVTVTWNGLSSVGNPMAPDLLRIDVLQAEPAGVLEVIGVLPPSASFMVVTDVVAGDEYTYAFRAVDTSGNEGALSSQPTIVVASVLDDPVLVGEIETIAAAASTGNDNIYSTSTVPAPETAPRTTGDNWWRIDGSGDVIEQWRWDGTNWVAVELTNAVIATLDAAKITTGTLAAARIAASSITSDKIAAGAITAVKIDADAIDGMTIVGINVFAGTLYTGTRTSSTLGQGTYLSSSGYLNSQNASAQNFFSVNPANETVFIGGKLTLKSDPGNKRIEIDDSAWPTYSGLRFYTNSSTINIAEIKVRDEAGPTGKPVGTLYLLSGKPSTTGAEQDGRATMFMAYNEIEQSVHDSAGSERNRIELTTSNFVIAQRAADGDLTHRIETTAAALYLQTYDPTLAAGSDQSSLVLATSRVGTSYWEAYGSIRITGNRFNLTTQDVSIQGGNISFNLSYDGSGQRVHCQTFYDRTSAAGADMHITSAGTVTRSTSASKYKINIVPQDFGDSVLNLTPVTWYDKQNTEMTADLLTASVENDMEKLKLLEATDIEPLRAWPGLIAEEVVDAGLEEFVNRNGDEIEGIAYDRLWVTLIPIVRSLRDRVNQLEIVSKP